MIATFMIKCRKPFLVLKLYSDSFENHLLKKKKVEVHIFDNARASDFSDRVPYKGLLKYMETGTPTCFEDLARGKTANVGYFL